MSIIVLNGRRFVAGLIWMARGGAWALSADARKFRRPYYVHWRRRTGLAPAGGEDLTGTSSLGASLLRHIGEVDPQTGVAVENWMALIEGENKRFALVQVRDGEVLADGEALLEDREAAVTAFEGQRSFGFSALYATPGLVEGAHHIDVAALPVESDMALALASLGRFHGARAAVLLTALTGAVLAAGWAVLNRETVWTWVAGPAPVEAPAPEPEETVAVVVQSMALIEACARAHEAHPPWLPAWRLETLFCEARLADHVLVTWRPEFEGKAVMVAKWRLLPGHDEALNRQLTERYLPDAGWYAAVVEGAEAVALVPLGPVLTGAGESPAFLALRRQVDIELGRRGMQVRYEEAGPGRYTIEALAREGLEGLSGLVNRIAGFEVTRLEASPGGAWRLTARAAEPEVLTVTRFSALAAQ